MCGVAATIEFLWGEWRGARALSDAEKFFFFGARLFFFFGPPVSTLTSPRLPLPNSLSPSSFSLSVAATGNLLKVTSGPDAGKLCLLDFGLVAEVPEPDREAMVSATIHLANRDWASLVDDFVALDFLPADCDRGVIIPVMDRVLSPYLAGGGAKAFNFQVRVVETIAQRREGGRETSNPVSNPLVPIAFHAMKSLAKPRFGRLTMPAF